MSEHSIASAPPTSPAPPEAAPLKRPGRCFITWLGLLILLVAFIRFAVIMIGQRITTGSFARGEGFTLGSLGLSMLLAFCAALLLLMVGSIVDSIRYGRWKKSDLALKNGA